MFSLCITRDPTMDTNAIFTMLKTIIVYTNTTTTTKMSVLSACMLPVSRQILENIYNDDTQSVVLYKLDRTYDLAFSFQCCAPMSSENPSASNPTHTHELLYRFVNSHPNIIKSSALSDCMVPSSCKKQRTT
jgi:hypothetical protein